LKANTSHWDNLNSKLLHSPDESPRSLKRDGTFIPTNNESQIVSMESKLISMQKEMNTPYEEK